MKKERNSPSFWEDQKNAEKVIFLLNRQERWFEEWNILKKELEEVIEMTDLSLEEEAQDELIKIANQYHTLYETYTTLKTKSLLYETYDVNDAFLTIHTGAGGTESCDWVKMLLRLYSRWSEQRGYTVKILDLLEAEGGIKSVSLEIKGEYAYGYLLSETGVHRLVRISPFDSNKKRHTTFASVYASPVIENDINIDIKQEHIRIDTYKSSGAGGQHVNTTDSAVRITHLETGIVVQCQNERSQIKNKQTAMKVLKSKLYSHIEKTRKEQQNQMSSEKKDIAWGHQIRSYVFHPYSLVKDHRTNVEIGNVQSVMNGEIDMFIESFLQERARVYEG